MSNDEDPPLRDLVAQSLTASGVLPKIKAELRASVFHALEKNPDVCESLTLNKELCAFSKTEKGSIILNLIREFLQFFNLDFTLAVFEPESCCGSTYHGLNRDELLKKCQILDSKKSPLLCDVLNLDVSSNKVDLSNSKHVYSPGLNSTYTKAEPSLDSTPVRLDTDEKVASTASSEGSSDVSCKTPEKNGSGGNSLGSNPSTPPNDRLNESLNLLQFTPVQQVRAVPKQNTDKLESHNEIDDNISKKPRPKPEGQPDSIMEEKKPVELSLNEQKSHGKSSTSSLSDLPPLAGFGKSTVSSLADLPPLGFGPKQKAINDVKRVMEGIEDITEGLNSLSSKSSKLEENGRPDSAGSQRSNTSEEVDEDISELLNSHPSSEGGLTADETISRLSNQSGIDYMESV